MKNTFGSIGSRILLSAKIYCEKGVKRGLTREGRRSKIGDVRDEIAMSGPEETQDIGAEKKFRKSEKKVLTKRRSCDILQKLSRKTGSKSTLKTI